ncbi:hypothetical protein SAMN02745181_3567 [Rubritalea squalenifaciens DSM 18772]|uniref:Hydrogenase nickel incorporation protein HypA n=2 Tax=Rubritalea TaxID=361050 RepID=A0A1M6R7J3_9BACT|nr:hypothetical protein SAMN02745181_3567 [Rubritalea squalenifaciens DSM 18772]
MIEMTIEELGLWIMAVTLLLLFFMILGSRARDRRYLKNRNKEIISCPVCGCLFEDRGSSKIVPCPNCGRDTQRGRDRSLG